MAYIGKVPTAVPLTSADIQDGTIALADLSATGTASASNFLRGDNSWAEAGGGKVLQVLSMTHNTEQEITTSTSTYNSSALTLSITPSATSSKILILYHMTNSQRSTSGYVHSTLNQNISGGSDVNLGGTSGLAMNGTDIGSDMSAVHSVNYLDSPNTTNAITYTVQTKASGTYRRFRDNVMGSLTLIEIGV